MIKLTENQINFLIDAINEAEMANTIGYPLPNGEPRDEDKEVMALNEFLTNLKPGQILKKEI